MSSSNLLQRVACHNSFPSLPLLQSFRKDSSALSMSRLPFGKWQQCPLKVLDSICHRLHRRCWLCHSCTQVARSTLSEFSLYPVLENRKVFFKYISFCSFQTASTNKDPHILEFFFFRFVCFLLLREDFCCMKGPKFQDSYFLMQNQSKRFIMNKKIFQKNIGWCSSKLRLF